MASNSASFEECPICQNQTSSENIIEHVNQCFEKQSIEIQKSPTVNNNKRQITRSTEKSYDIFNFKRKKPKIEDEKIIIDKTETKQEVKVVKEISPLLAEKMRPNSFEYYFGQKALEEKSIIRNLINTNTITSSIFWGPPGCGKTTLAHIIYNHCNRHKELFRFIKMSACTSGVNDVKEVIKQAINYKNIFKRQTILFMDEIHRFNKLQQDQFLPHVENGTIILLGATTENPSFSLNSALLSRCRVIVLEKLSSNDIMKILRRALTVCNAIEITDNVEVNESIISKLNCEPKIAITEESLKWIADSSDGDARIALNSFEICVKQAFDKNSSDKKQITLKDIKEVIKKTHLLYDRNGDQHYDIISALHKSIRASDENASLYWLTRMLISGEDPRYICRRLIRSASEDIGNADPQALIMAISTLQAVEKIGMPEADCILAQLTTYLARAPKSREACESLSKCKLLIQNYKGPMPSVPIHLRNAPTNLMKNLGYGKNYNMLHMDESGLNYLPEDLKDVNFFV